MGTARRRQDNTRAADREAHAGRFRAVQRSAERRQRDQGGNGGCRAESPGRPAHGGFVDEIHRFNKAQQDAFLPYVEKGDIILIGATTENPSFEVISALLSRAKVYALAPLSVPEIVTLLSRALRITERGLGGRNLQLRRVLEQIAVYAGGDGRSAYNMLELAALAAPDGQITGETLEDILQRKTLLYDKSGEEHYNLISALHKSVRSSDVQAALYWLARMLEAGEDRMYLARRLMRMAIEDIGTGRSACVGTGCGGTTVRAFSRNSRRGPGAGADRNLSFAGAEVGRCLYRALNACSRGGAEWIPHPVPMQIRNAPTRYMKEWGYGSGYQHAHNFAKALTNMECLPEPLRGVEFYKPTDRGFEKRLRERLEEIESIRKTDNDF